MLLLIPFEENVNQPQCGFFSCAKISTMLRAVCVQSRNRKRVGWWRKFCFTFLGGVKIFLKFSDTALAVWNN